MNHAGDRFAWGAVATAIAAVIPVTRYKRNGTVELTEYVFDPSWA
jgi:hypothetical protein